MNRKFYKTKEWLYEQYWVLEKSQSQIANECNINQGTVHNWLKKFDIPARTLKEAMKGERNGMYGKKHSIETKNKISESNKGKNKGKNNPDWKGDDATYSGFHMWMKKQKLKPNKCPKCRKKKNRMELSFDHNLGDYTRNPNDYIYLCSSCHKKRDNEFRKKLNKNKLIGD